MNKKIVIIFALIVIALVAGLVFWNKKNPSINQNPNPNPKLVTGSEKETFSGTITDFSTDCFADGICSVSVDGKKVIIMAGFRMGDIPPVGKLLGVDSIGDLEGKVGWHANVYATTTPEGDYTLYGNPDYYVEVLDIK